jgi:hypothetical protein
MLTDRMEDLSAGAVSAVAQVLEPLPAMAQASPRHG